MVRVVFGRKFFECFLDHLFVLTFHELQIGLASRSAAPVRMIEENVAFSAVMACSTLFLPFPRMVLKKAWMAPAV